MLVKALIVLVLLVIFGSMASALIWLIKDNGRSERTVKALTVRIALSLGLFVFLMIGYAAGWIAPHSL
ncbi:MAG: twin transmembrane helix small protein [Pseudomonadota bacterium]|nr:MAG: twin transmembrane helix small protein [Pseudomonadota bacterium]